MPTLTSPAEGVPHPVVRHSNYRIEFGPRAFEVDPMGARIVTFSLDGRSVVLPQEESPVAFGSSFWPSPQKDWGWPPPPEFDAKAWDARIDGPVLELTSDTNVPLGLSAVQRVFADAARELLVIEHELHNRGAAPRAVAPWQNTRVRPRGLTFFPSETGTLPHSEMALAAVDGVVWFQHDPATTTKSAKLFADGEEGWLAHVDGDLLFVKLFPEVSLAATAPTEAEIEIYVHDSGTFVEMEQQGPYLELGPGGVSSWRVEWLVLRLPEALAAESGSLALLAFTRAAVARARGG